MTIDFSEDDFVTWNRRRTTGLTRDDLEVKVTESESDTLHLTEIDLDVDSVKSERRRLKEKNENLDSLLNKLC
jgi:hypothetical protein